MAGDDEEPDAADARVRRQIRRGSVIWTAVVGGATGVLAAVAVQGFAHPANQSAWTTGLMAGGAVGLPLLQSLLRRTGVITRGIDWELMQPLLAFLLGVAPAFAFLGALYVGMWVAVPNAEETEHVAGDFAWVGVIGWPMLAGWVRVLMNRPTLRPPWWAATWLFVGLPVTAVIMALRAEPSQTANWVGGMIFGALMLTPVAIWRYRRVRRLINDEEPDASTEDGEEEAEEPEANAAEDPEANAAEEPDFAPSPLVYASWGRRAVAFLIDSVPFLLLSTVPALVGHRMGGVAGGVVIAVSAGVGTWVALISNRWFLGGRTGQTWGRRVMDIQLVSERTGRPIGMTRAFLRDLKHFFLDNPVLCLGWLLPLWDTRFQTLADKATHTVVIRVGHGAAPDTEDSAAPGRPGQPS